VQLNVANDTASATTQITNLVNDYNDFISYLQQQTAYKPGTGTAAGTAGPLNGNSSIVGLQSQVEQVLLAVAPNLPSQMNRLGALGITPDSNGQLKIDTNQLNSALSGGVSGVSFSDIKNLFGLQGQSGSASVQFATGTSATKVSATPYTVHITQAAQRAAVTSTNVVASSTVIDGTNNTLSLSIDGKASGTITLASGTYSQLQLANEVQLETNSALAANGASVSVSVSNNKLVVTSDRYGSASSITGLSGNSLSALGFSGSETSTGTDVAGSYVVNGVTETATGVGQILTGNSNNANTAGLAVVVSLTQSQIGAGGTDSNLTVTRGLASTLDNTLKDLLDPVNGQISLIANQISKSITDAQADVTKETAAMSAQKTALLQQFAAMETTLANLQQQGNLLTSVLANSNVNNSSSSSSSSSKSFTPNLSTTSG
jgi:flagellar hook-associated protein 2